jgi:hypothetical protein
MKVMVKLRDADYAGVAKSPAVHRTAKPEIDPIVSTRLVRVMIC